MMTSTHGKEMMANSPRYYEASRVFQAHIEAKGIELDDLDTILADIEAQLTASTATWGLRYWEEMCGLPTNTQDSLETRRARVLAKLRSFSSAKRYDILNVIKSFVKSGRVDLVEHASEYRFVAILAAEADANVPGILAAIEEARPAHLAFSLILAILSRMAVVHDRIVTWHVPVKSGMPSSIRRLDRLNRSINGNFRLNASVSIAPIPGLSGWTLANGRTNHKTHYNFLVPRKMGEIRAMSVSPDYQDARYRLDGRFNLDYEVQDSRWFLSGAATIGYEGYLAGSLLLNSAWSLNFARFLDGKVVTTPRHYLAGYGEVPLEVEHRQLDGTWKLGKTMETHRLVWVKWRDGIVIERGLVS
ncbi:MAG: DUF2313 domain-containing protein [Firmicutes bacterium]|nr:DUF2313 domain-containing protein [Bacillota bacterium]